MNKIFICQLCNRHFNRKYNLNQHMKRKNPCVVIKQNLPKSSKIFQNLPKPSISFQNLPFSPKNNKSVEMNEKRFGCDFCKRSYKHNYNLTKHLKTCKVKKEQEQEQEIDFINNFRKSVEISHTSLRNEIFKIKEEMEIMNEKLVIN